MIVQAKNIVTTFGEHVVHDGVSFEINKGEIFGLLGGSGSGKTTLLRQMILLQTPTKGQMSILGKNLTGIDPTDAQKLRLRWGVLFQFGALFSSLSILENVMIPLQEYTDLPNYFIEELALLKIQMVGLDKEVAKLSPSQLSGGMKKRAALARALALDPEILFLDEPTSGLDPASARAFDRLIHNLRQLLDITVVMVTHDKDTIANVLDRFIILGDAKILAQGDFQTLQQSDPQLMKKFME